jgi:hypothetical protein
VTWQVGAFALLALALLGGFAWYERVRPDARIVALVGTLAAFAALGRIAFAAVPNVKPTTDIVLIAGYALGAGPGFAVGALAGLTSNFFFGQGPWTPWQMAGWGAVGVIGAGVAWLMAARSLGRPRRAGSLRDLGLRRGARPAGYLPPPLGRWSLAIICCIVGFGFTALQDVGDWVTYSDHSWAQLGVYVGTGLGFDAIHAAGCVAFALAIGPALIRSIQRFSRRIQVNWLSAGGIVPGLVLAVVLGAALIRPPAPARAAGASAAAARAAGASAAAARGAGASPAAVRAAAVSYLLGAENGDGGFGDAPGRPSNQLYAGWAALGLVSAGYDLGRVARGPGLLAYIRSGAGAPSDVGAVERTILVARAAGLAPRSFGGHDLVAELERHIRADGSVSGQVNWTAFAVLALRAAGVSPSAETLRWLVRQQDADGGFSFAGAGGSSDVDDTGAVLEALAGDRATAVVTARAVSYLRRQQNRDGGFPSQPGASPNAQSTAWAIQGLDAVGVPAAGVDHSGGSSPLAYLDALATPSGAIRYSRGVVQSPVWVTGEALMALEGKPLPLTPQPAPRSAAAPSHARASGPAATPHAGARPAAASPTETSGSTAHGAAPRGRGTDSPSRPPAPRTPAASQRAPARGGAVVLDRLAAVAGVVTAVLLAPMGLG